MGQANPSTKRKPSEKVDRPPKKPKVVMGSIVGKMKGPDLVKPSLGKGKGLLKGPDLVTEKRPVLLREDSRVYAQAVVDHHQG